MRQLAKLATLNANQVIDNRVNQSDKYTFSINDLLSHLRINKKNVSIEGFDISHHSGKDGVASAVKFSSQGPEKSEYRLFNIPADLTGNDVGSIQHVLERRIKQSNEKPLPEIILIDGGKSQQNPALRTFSKNLKNPIFAIPKAWIS